MYRLSRTSSLRLLVSPSLLALSLCYLVAYHPAFAQVQIINGTWEWPDQGIGCLDPNGDTAECAFVFDLLPYEGKLVVGGGFFYAGGIPAKYLAVWDRESWSTLGEGFPEGPVKTLLELDSALYIGGGFNSIGGLPINACAKWDGETWSELGEGLLPTIVVRDLEAWNDGKGSILFVAAQTIFRWDGTDWSIPGGGVSGGGGGAYALAVFDDGAGPALYAAGLFKYAGGVLCNGVAKWNGTTWSPLGQGITSAAGYGLALAAYDDGTGAALYLGGYFQEIDGKPIIAVARWDGQTWSAVDDPDFQPGTEVTEVRVLDDGSGPELYVVATHRLQKWNGKRWLRYPPVSVGFLTATIFPGPAGPTLHVGGGINLGDFDNPRYTNIAYFRRGFACGDLNGDGVTDQKDLGILLAVFNCTGYCAGDADGDGDVDQSDLGILLAHFGQECG
ncbi:MAG: hypothetical protein LC135_10400 [Phycisphaerae bacterium]|nr:hypothetical protein [Phycisphaerae bacterium]MCZ2400258.1 hypothetical protein [Phycisphaerae bacterium]